MALLFCDEASGTQFLIFNILIFSSTHFHTSPSPTHEAGPADTLEEERGRLEYEGGAHSTCTTDTES